MAHEAYSPVGYAYNADQFCLDCIPDVIAKPNTYGLDEYGKRRVMERFGGNGMTVGRNVGCNCCECRLDRIAAARGINRYDESSYDMSDFPKAIPYHNDIHAECELEESWEPHWSCDGRCANCGAIIDGIERGYGHSHVTVCPGEDAYLDRLEQQMEEDDDE